MINYEMYDCVIVGIGNYFPPMLRKLDGQEMDNQIFPKFSNYDLVGYKESCS